MRTLEVRRHAQRDPEADRLSQEGRAHAQSVGASLAGGYAVVFISPAQRAAETVAWFLRGLGEQLPAHAVVPGLAAKDNDGSPLAMAGVLSALLDAVPEDARGLAVSHTPLIERAVLGISAREIGPLAECEGVLLSKADDGSPVDVEELRLPS
jgi:phosphohistidine phosphatase SixA